MGSVRGAQAVAMAKEGANRRTGGKSKHKGRWASMDADVDRSDDQMDIARGRGLVDGVFQGAGMQDGTHNAIMVGSDYQSDGLKNLSNIEDGYYISPEFLDKFTIHVTKNFLKLPKIKVPLILGIWGGEGPGQDLPCNLAYKKLGINPIVMSAGELESGNAGEPAKLIRTRYREASDTIKKGKMCSLFINDLDFFGALRARVYDDMVKDFCANIGIENLGKRLVNSKDGDVSFDNPNMSLDNLLEYGNLLVGEQ